MLRYAAFKWNRQAPAQKQLADSLLRRLRSTDSAWNIAFSREGLAVAYIGAKPGASDAIPLSNGGGVVLGTVFQRGLGNDAYCCASIQSNDADQIVATIGKHLVERYWGRYVAFVSLPDGATAIIRDPTGGMPCLVTSHAGVAICTSHLEDVVRLGLHQFSVNWDYVAMRMVAAMAETRETALVGVSNVVGGECLEISSDGSRTSRRLLWDPTAIASSEPLENFDLAVSTVRHTTRACVHAWASCYSGILHKVSGGLDSAIVLGCLADAPTQPRITCLNYHSPGVNSDERHFARLATHRVGLQLVEQQRIVHTELWSMQSLPRTPVPPLYPHHIEQASVEAQLTSQNDLTAIFDGEGGDGLFYQVPLCAAAADYAYTHGVDTSFLHVALNVARATDTSVWKVVGDALKKGVLAHRRWDPLEDAYSYRKLVAQDVIRDLRSNRRFLHPWLARTRKLPIGKLWHVSYLSTPVNAFDVMRAPNDPDLVQPLMSQPLYELFLRIPTYTLTRGARDRAVARAAFAADLPPEIRRRRSKGGMNEHAKAVLSSNMAFVREMLLDGILVRERLLDRRAVEDALTIRPNKNAPTMLEMFSHLSVETWLRTWLDERQRAAA